MTESSTKSFEPIFENPLENYPGLTINDLNRYFYHQNYRRYFAKYDNIKEGLFLAEGRGVKKLPDQSIDLIITSLKGTLARYRQTRVPNDITKIL